MTYTCPCRVIRWWNPGATVRHVADCEEAMKAPDWVWDTLPKPTDPIHVWDMDGGGWASCVGSHCRYCENGHVAHRIPDEPVPALLLLLTYVLVIYGVIALVGDLIAHL